MWPISWPITEAISASLFMWVRIPRVKYTGPPGRAKALMAASSTTPKRQGMSGRSLLAAMLIPIRET